MALFDTASEDEEREKPVQTGKTAMRCHTERGKQLFDVRRFNSEAALLENAPWHLEAGGVYHIISGGDVDALTFLRHVVRQQHLKFCLVSSWCYGVEDVSEMGYWLKRGAVDRFDFYCGEIAKASYAMCAAEMPITETLEIAEMTENEWKNHPEAGKRYKKGQLKTKMAIRQAIVKGAKSGNPALLKAWKEIADKTEDAEILRHFTEKQPESGETARETGEFADI